MAGAPALSKAGGGLQRRGPSRRAGRLPGPGGAEAPAIGDGPAAKGRLGCEARLVDAALIPSIVRC